MTLEDSLPYILVLGLLGYFGQGLIRVMLKYPTKEEDDMPNYDTNHVYDSADGNELLVAKTKCLELAAARHNVTSNVDDIVNDAKKFWDFIALEDSSDE